jgi:hypothetical protein
MNASFLRTAGAVALLASMAAAPVHAQSHSACPALQDHLQEALASTVQRVGLAGQAQVEVDLAGRRVVAVRATGAPPAYERALHRALRNLDCPAGDEGRRTMSFNVRFVDPWGRELRDGRLVVAIRAGAASALRTQTP